MNRPGGENPARAFYDRISHVYDMIADASEHSARETGLGLLAARAGETVLEIGFGTGHALLELARAVGAEGRVHGLDISPGMLAVATKRLEGAGIAQRVELATGEAPPLPYEDAMFDAVFMSFTLELFPEETIPLVLAETRRVLRPGGRLGVVSMATPPPGEGEGALTQTYVWLHRHFPHIVDCRPIDVERWIRDAGFEALRVEPLTIWTLRVAAIVASSAGPPR